MAFLGALLVISDLILSQVSDTLRLPQPTENTIFLNKKNTGQKLRPGGPSLTNLILLKKVEVKAQGGKKAERIQHTRAFFFRRSNVETGLFQQNLI
jgi:hypothetical protein